MQRFAIARTVLFGLCVLAQAQAAEMSAGGSAASATVRTPPAEIPFSSFASPAAERALLDLAKAPAEPNLAGDVEALRRYHAKSTDEILAGMRKLYAVTIATETLGGVRADVVTPAAGVSPKNRERILINLHGGGFMWGAGSGALVEAVPIAAVNRVTVATLDYRMAPEHKFPAASEDVAAAYRALLKKYRAENIGLYGCSAGGILAAQAVAWFAKHGLLQPGAIASLCGTGAELEGDSAYLAPLLAGQAIAPGAKPLTLTSLPYFAGVSAQDPLAFPMVSADVLARFPPTLLLAGSRDFAASSLTTMHRRLYQAGVPSELFLFDGLWHAFMMVPTLPESHEVYTIVGRFFDEHLGKESRPR
jgi:acetyl esterase/lipase